MSDQSDKMYGLPKEPQNKYEAAEEEVRQWLAENEDEERKTAQDLRPKLDKWYRDHEPALRQLFHFTGCIETLSRTAHRRSECSTPADRFRRFNENRIRSEVTMYAAMATEPEIKLMHSLLQRAFPKINEIIREQHIGTSWDSRVLDRAIREFEDDRAEEARATLDEDSVRQRAQEIAHMVEERDKHHGYKVDASDISDDEEKPKEVESLRDLVDETTPKKDKKFTVDCDEDSEEKASVEKVNVAKILMELSEDQKAIDSGEENSEKDSDQENREEEEVEPPPKMMRLTPPNSPAEQD